MMQHYFDDIGDYLDSSGQLNRNFLDEHNFCSILVIDRPYPEDLDAISGSFPPGNLDEPVLIITITKQSEPADRQKLTGCDAIWQGLSENFFLNQFLVTKDFFLWSPVDSDYFVVATNRSNSNCIDLLGQKAMAEIQELLDEDSLSKLEKEFLLNGIKKYQRN